MSDHDIEFIEIENWTTDKIRNFVRTLLKEIESRETSVNPTKELVPTNTMPLNQFRVIEVTVGSGHLSTHLVHHSHVERMVQALIKLHHNPGINPHNQRKAAGLLGIQVYVPEPRGPYWWTVPDLQKNDDVNGAVLFDHGAMTQYRWTRDEDGKPIEIGTLNSP